MLFTHIVSVINHSEKGIYVEESHKFREKEARLIIIYLELVYVFLYKKRYL